MDSGFGNPIYWTLPVLSTIIHFTTLQHTNQKLVFSVRYHFRLRPVSLFCVCIYVSFLTPCLRVNCQERLRESELLYEWRYTTNQLILAPSSLKLTARFFSQLNTCGHSPYTISSLMRRWVCHLQLLLVLASAVILGSESRGAGNHILLSQIQDLPFVASYYSQGYDGGIPIRLHRRRMRPV
jgi:hypothetical protein